jgi:hypothetical protein
MAVFAGFAALSRWVERVGEMTARHLGMWSEERGVENRTLNANMTRIWR